MYCMCFKLVTVRKIKLFVITQLRERCKMIPRSKIFHFGYELAAWRSLNAHSQVEFILSRKRSRRSLYDKMLYDNIRDTKINKKYDGFVQPTYKMNINWFFCQVAYIWLLKNKIWRWSEQGRWWMKNFFNEKTVLRAQSFNYERVKNWKQESVLLLFIAKISTSESLTL